MRLPYPSPSPRACSNSCPSSRWCHPTISSSVIPFSAFNLKTSLKVFSSESVLHNRWPKYWSFSLSPSNEYSGLVSSRIDWFDLLAVQGTLKSLLQHHSSKAILWCPAFFIVQLSHLYMTTGKAKSLTILTFVGKVMSLLFNILSGFVIAFFQEQACFNYHGCSHCTQRFRTQENKSLSLFPLLPHLFAMKWWGQMLWSLFFECWV